MFPPVMWFSHFLSECISSNGNQQFWLQNEDIGGVNFPLDPPVPKRVFLVESGLITVMPRQDEDITNLTFQLGQQFRWSAVVPVLAEQTERFA